jgi:hypothetical protein
VPRALSARRSRSGSRAREPRSQEPTRTLDEAGGTVAFLASDDAGFITAAAVPLDGGITAAFTVPE